MSDGMNRWQGIGNLGADGELRVTPSGQSVLKLRLACTESYLDRNNTRQERTEWVNCTVWAKRAEGLAQILSQGDRIYVEGRLQTREWDDKEGQKRRTTEVIAQTVNVIVFITKSKETKAGRVVQEIIEVKGYNTSLKQYQYREVGDSEQSFSLGPVVLY